MSGAEFESPRLSLRELRNALGGEIVGFESVSDTRCYDVRVDSREVSLGSLFAALPGTAQDGREYALDAARRGASAMLTPTLVEKAKREAPDMVQWVHPDARRVAGLAASLLRGEPSRDLFTVGVTGTNGKTTVCHLVQQILRHCGTNAGVLGTAGHSIAAANGSEIRSSEIRSNKNRSDKNFAEFKLENVAATHTTSDGPTLQRLLEQHRRGGGDAIALELSSHALDQQRHAGLEVDVAVYTNLTREHLDYHGSLDEYAQAKAELFRSLRPGSVAVINAQASHAEVMIDAATQAGARIVTYGIETVDSSSEDAVTQRIGSFLDLSASRLEAGASGTTFFLSGMGISGEQVVLPLAGRFNVENALAALAASLLSGASPSTAVEGLAAVSSAPGRLERVVPSFGRGGEQNTEASQAGEGVEVFVDYAHTSDALENVLTTLRERLEACGRGGRLLAVFGCGGDRDVTKRAPMGEVVDRLADVAVLTSDNPRSEAPEDICADVLRGMRVSRAELHVELDRAKAIRWAIEHAREDDVVLVAGKGHETTQEIQGRKFPFDDRLEIAAILKERS